MAVSEACWRVGQGQRAALLHTRTVPVQAMRAVIKSMLSVRVRVLPLVVLVRCGFAAVAALACGRNLVLPEINDWPSSRLTRSPALCSTDRNRRCSRLSHLPHLPHLPRHRPHHRWRRHCIIEVGRPRLTLLPL